jgi:hypothetical protein
MPNFGWQAAYNWQGGVWKPIGPWSTVRIGACSQVPGRNDLFGINADSRELEHVVKPSGYYENLGGRCASKPAAVSREFGSMEVFVIDDNHNIFVKTWGQFFKLDDFT